MRGLCQLSARWYQQFFWTARSTGHHQCFQFFRPPQTRHYRQGLKGTRDSVNAPSTSDDVKVKEFEQYGSDAGTRRAIDPKREINLDEADVLAKIKRLEEELAVLKEGPFGPNSDFMKSIPAENRAQILKDLEAEGLLDPEGDELLNVVEIEDMVEEDILEEPVSNKTPGVTLRIPKRQKEFVKRFNQALDDSSRSEGDTLKHLNLWKWYLRCHQHVSNFSSVIPEDVWQILWQSVLQYAYRPKHVVMLAKDMASAGVDLDERQTLAYLDALLAENDVGQALAMWEQRTAFLNVEPYALEYWTVGVRLYAALGRPRKAQDIAFQYLEDHVVSNGDMLVPILSAWAKSQDPNAAQKAWTCYLRLRTILKDKMTVDLYKDISGSLLKSGYADMALAVFKDMRSAQGQPESDSIDIYRRALDHFKDIHSQGVTEQHINRIGLTALIVFPKQFQNKFFFGSWIKMLIGQGEIDSAATVIELMYERGVKLDAKHLNGIVGAWLREGSPSSRRKAEQLAWSMINARVEFVKRRDRRAENPMSTQVDSLGSSISLRLIPQQQKPDVAELATISTPPTRHLPAFLKRAAPPANIETFSILLLYYTRRSDTKHAEHLTQVMTGAADIKPNSFILNHWLYATLRSSDIQGVWDKYNGLKHDIRPDLETFAALWDAAKVNYDKARVARGEKFPSARRLFAEMKIWRHFLTEKQLQIAKDDFSPDLHDSVTRSFYLCSDLPGMLCALHGMKDSFDQYPNENTTRTILLLISRTLPHAALTGPARMRQRRSNLQNSVKMISGILEAIADQHKVKLVAEGIDLESLDPASEVAKNAHLHILTEFLLIVMNRMKKVRGDVKNEVKTVAKVMEVDIGNIDFECLKAEEG